jgi:glutaminyl-peptide cyclotransferase
MFHMKKKHIISYSFRVLGALLIVGLANCGGDKKERARAIEAEEDEKIIDVPDFNADSSYAFIQQQVDFGPRVPNTEAHRKTANFLKKKLEEYGAEVTAQEFTAVTFDNNELQLQNIIASFFPEKQKRILLTAHWDTRPFADKDEERKYEPIEGANDGGSGVGVLLEIARVLGTANLKPGVGIDIILFDGEDWGPPEGANIPDPKGFYRSWWALGSQYWSKNKHEPGYSAFYGILLDMVGAKNATFYQEGISREYAPSVVRKVWQRAEKLGYGHVFIDRKAPAITDDHVFINVNAQIPTIDIVHYDPKYGYFGDYHHTHKDNMDLISRSTLEAVGETVLHTVYYE